MLTNKLGLPEPILRAAEAEMYSKGDARYSVTELLKPPRMAALQRLYRDVIVEDVADQIWSVLGKIGHGILEASGAPETGAILEERLYMDVAGVRVSGAMDHTVLLPTGQLDDYKFTNVYSVSRGCKAEWEEQLNLYRLLRTVNGQAVERLRIVAILRDWLLSRARAAGHLYESTGFDEEGNTVYKFVKEEPGAWYPAQQVVTVDVKMWPIQQAQLFIEGRVAAHLAADEWATHLAAGTLSDITEPRCTDADRWKKPDVYACMKEGRKTAIKKYDTKGEAEYAATQQKGGYVEFRPGPYTRCIDYCSVGRAGLCSQWEADKKQGAATALEVDTSAFD